MDRSAGGLERTIVNILTRRDRVTGQKKYLKKQWLRAFQN